MRSFRYRGGGLGMFGSGPKLTRENFLNGGLVIAHCGMKGTLALIRLHTLLVRLSSLEAQSSTVPDLRVKYVPCTDLKQISS